MWARRIFVVHQKEKTHRKERNAGHRPFPKLKRRQKEAREKLHIKKNNSLET